MVNVQFEEPEVKSFSRTGQNNNESGGKLVKLLIRSGMAKSEKQANTVLLIVSIVFFAAAFLVMFD